MPRLPYKPSDVAEPADVVAAIRARRGGRLLHLDRMLLYSPAFARGWNALLGEVRGGLSLPAKLRELAICTVAVLSEAAYEFHHHAPLLLRAGGTPAQVDALRQLGADAPAAGPFDATELAVVRFTHQLTRKARIDDAAFAAVRAVLPDEQVVELVGVVAAYNMVSRFLVALDIQPEA